MPAAGRDAVKTAALPSESPALAAAQMECTRLAAELEAVQQADDAEFSRLLDIISEPLQRPESPIFVLFNKVHTGLVLQ